MPYTNYTLSDLLSLSRNRLQFHPFYSSDYELTDALNESMRVFQLATAYWKNRFTIATVATRVVYNLGSLVDANGNRQILAPLRLQFNGSPVNPVSLFDMDRMIPGWQAQTTASLGAPSSPSCWGVFGAPNFIFIWPADAAGSNTMLLDAVIPAPVLSVASPGASINIDSSEIRNLLDYAQHILAFKRGGMAFAETMPLFKSFMTEAMRRNAMLRASDVFRSVMGFPEQRAERPRSVAEWGKRGRYAGVK